MVQVCLVRLWLPLTLALPLAAQFDAAAVIQYTAERVDISMRASAMNNRGWIVGFGGGVHPARYRPGIGTERLSAHLGDLRDINDAGTAVGYIFDYAGLHEAIIRPAGAPVKRLGYLPGSSFSEAVAINETGQVVGWSTNARGQDRPFIYTDATGMQMLFDQRGRATGINEAGQVTGVFRGPSGDTSFLWDPTLGLIDIEEQPSVTLNFSASGIADNGTVVGRTRRGMATFSLDNGLRRPQGLVFGMRPSGVNDRGWVVGCDPCAPNERPQPAIYVYGQGVRNLNTLLTTPTPYPLTHGIDINDRDEILAEIQTEGYYILRRVR